MTTRPELPIDPIDTERERRMSLLSIELSQERIRDADREVARRLAVAAQVRALRTRRDAETTAARLRRLLTTR